MATTAAQLKGCVEIYPANVSHQITEKETNIAIISLVSASLSLLGSASILGFITWRKLLKVKTVLSLFHLSLADFILAFFWLLTTTKFFLSKHEDPAYTAISCFIFQLVTETMHLATIFLTINYAVDVYMKMLDRTVKVHNVTEGNDVEESITKKRIKKSLYVISWTLPLVIMMPVFVNVRSNRISACQKCVIFIDVAVLICGSVPWDYGYIALAVTLTISILLLLIIYFLSLKLYWQAVPGFRTDHQRKQLFNMQVRVTVYLLVFIACWMPGLWISYHKWARHAPTRSKGFLDVQPLHIVFLMQAALAPLQGFLNSIVYGWTKKTFRSTRSPNHLIAPHNGTLVTPYYDYSQSDYSDYNSEDSIYSPENTDATLGY